MSIHWYCKNGGCIVSLSPGISLFIWIIFLQKPGQLRIIGGQWRSRVIRFPQLHNLRPSPDAVRETLFNWLSGHIPDSVCLDLFAGSGAFGFEAVSRGARKAVLVESNRSTVRQLHKTSQLLDADNRIEIQHNRVEDYFKSTDDKFDLVFMDPPFQPGQIEMTCQGLLGSGCLQREALVYIESKKSNIPLPIPETWHIIRQVERGLVRSTLIHIQD